MANYTRQNMTPGNTADCYLPGCLGVTGGLCIGALPEGAPLNQTLWWCCTPYAETCRGGQSACPGTECSSDSATWCCNGELEACPGAGGLEGSCVPRDFANPVLSGPAWGPDAVTSGTANGTNSTTIATSETSTSSGTTTIKATQTETSATSSATGTNGGGGVGGGESGGISTGAAAGVGVVGGGLFVLALVGCVWWFRRRGRARGTGTGTGPGDGIYMGEYATSQKKPVEVDGQGLHEMEAAIRSEMEAGRSRSIARSEEHIVKSEHSI